MSPQQTGNIEGPSNKEAFAFVQELAQELSAGRIDIPSFPDVAVRVRKVLADDSADASTIARVVGSEPALAAKLLQIANSAAVNPRGQPVTELRTAIARLGLSMVRSASIAFAIEQLRQAPALAPLRKPLNELWERSVKVAAMSYVVARSWSRINPDTALLAGLMHGMGRVYILTRTITPGCSPTWPATSRSCRTGTRPSPRQCSRTGISARRSSRRWNSTPTSSANTKAQPTSPTC